MQFPFVLGKSKWFYIVTVIYFDLSLLPPATKLGQGNIFTGICDSVHRGVLPQCMLGFQPPPQDQAGTPLRPGRHPLPGTRPGRHPPGTRQAPPRDQAAHPPDQSILGDTVNERAVCILLKCNLVYIMGLYTF